MKELEIIKFGKQNLTKDKNLIYSIKELLALCIFSPTEVKLSSIIDCYASKPYLELLLIKFGNVLIGIVGIRLMSEKILIKHISVSPYYRKHGIGRQIIQLLPLRYKVKTIEAETDSDALDFYKKAGFTIQRIQVNLSFPRIIDPEMS